MGDRVCGTVAVYPRCKALARSPSAIRPINGKRPFVPEQPDGLATEKRERIASMVVIRVARTEQRCLCCRTRSPSKKS